MPDPTPDKPSTKWSATAGPSATAGLVSSRSILTALAFLATTLFLLGCGLEGQPFGKDKDNDEPVSPALVTEERVAAKDPGTPAATALTWWRGIQTRNPEAVKGTYTPKVRADLPDTFDAAVIAVLAPTAVESSITTDSFEEQTDNRGTLFATIDSPNATMNGPVSLPMSRVRGEWLISSSAFIRTLPGAIELAEALNQIQLEDESSKEKDSSKANGSSGG